MMRKIKVGIENIRRHAIYGIFTCSIVRSIANYLKNRYVMDTEDMPSITAVLMRSYIVIINFIVSDDLKTASGPHTYWINGIGCEIELAQVMKVYVQLIFLHIETCKFANAK